MTAMFYCVSVEAGRFIEFEIWFHERGFDFYPINLAVQQSSENLVRRVFEKGGTTAHTFQVILKSMDSVMAVSAKKIYEYFHTTDRPLVSPIPFRLA